MRSLVFLFLSFLSLQGLAAMSVLNKSAAKYYIQGNNYFLSHAALGLACISFQSSTTEPECNAAFLGETESGYFGANIYFGNDYNTVYKNRDALAQNNKYDFLRSILLEKDPVQFEASTQLWYRGESFSLTYQPLGATYYSAVNNQAYPQIAIHAMQEQSATFQYGGFVDSQLKAGLQIRAIERRFVYEEFYFFDAVPALENYLVPRTQRLLFFEPSMAYYFFEEEDEKKKYWNPIFSFQLLQTGFVDKSYEGIPTRPLGQMGLSFNPFTSRGNLNFGVGYTIISEIKPAPRARLGVSYQLGLADFSSSTDLESWSFGLKTVYRSFNLGLMLSRNVVENFSDVKQTKDSVNVEIQLLL